MKKYVLVFASAYLVLTVVVATATTLIDFNGGAGLNVAVTLAATLFAGANFVKDQGRAPTLDETKAFSWRALVATWAVSLVAVVLAVAFLLGPEEKNAVLRVLAWPMGYLIGLVAALFLSAIYYLVIRWSFSWYTRTAAKKVSNPS